MEIFNLLSIVNDVDIGVFGETLHVHLNWIGKIIKFLIEGVGMVGVGIILFSLVLKLIVLPFDIYQRIAMRKQNIKMKENQARMEKLQKQYANNKEMYNQKVMEMYKESGISMFSSCLPMILSLVIFIVAINAFNAYSQYSNIENYNTMVDAYNAKIEQYCADLDGEKTDVSVTEDGQFILVKDNAEGKYIYYTLPYVENYEENDYAYIRDYRKEEKFYKIDVEKAYQNAEIKAAVESALEAARAELPVEQSADLTEEQKAEIAKTAVKNYFTTAAQQAVVDVYNDEVVHRTEFIWIKNIWATDASYKHPVLSYSDFEAEASREDFNVNGKKVDYKSATKYTNVYKQDTYNVVTSGLSAQKNAANGYFILIALSIGTILLQQFVTMRSQKEQQQYSSVDGQGAQQQKMTMIIMTGMFAIFSFMYSSAFSIYMITSNLFSLVSTLVINKAVDIAQEKKEEKAFREKHERRLPGKKTNNDKK
ncbi:MAG: YidC/Oxa1 family membrane protein insertase [Clostridia bacterium]|nr:YidC/Oxa1 family membrane protein insertase [Clostridia bacterium]